MNWGTPPGHSLGKFNVYVGETLIGDGVTFNHATGLLYRSQPYGVKPEHNVFEIQEALRGGFCRLNAYTAIAIKEVR